MADKMMRNALRSPAGLAKPMQGDDDGNAYVTERPLKVYNFLRDNTPVNINSNGQWVRSVTSGASTFTLIGLTNVKDGEIDVSIGNIIDNSSISHDFKTYKIDNYRFETDILVCKSDIVRVTIRNNSNNTITISELKLAENVKLKPIKQEKIERIYHKKYTVNDLFEIENNEVKNTKLNQLSFEQIRHNISEYNRFKLYVDSNYDIPFDIDVYEKLKGEILTSIAVFNGDEFLFGSNGSKQSTAIPSINNSSNLSGRYRFPIHDAIEILNDAVEELVIRVRAAKTTKVSSNNRNNLILNVTLLGVRE